MKPSSRHLFETTPIEFSEFLPHPVRILITKCAFVLSLFVPAKMNSHADPYAIYSSHTPIKRKVVKFCCTGDALGLLVALSRN